MADADLSRVRVELCDESKNIHRVIWDGERT